MIFFLPWKKAFLEGWVVQRRRRNRCDDHGLNLSLLCVDLLTHFFLPGKSHELVSRIILNIFISQISERYF